MKERQSRADQAADGQRREDAQRADDSSLSAEEREEVVESQPPRPQVLHETIRLQGDHELDRTAAALWWSALAAGLSIGLSMMAMGLLRTHMGTSPFAPMISALGYPAGFLAIILARQQLFTENTITAVLPLMSDPSWSMLGKLMRLWGIVMLGNMVGAMVFAYAILHLPIFSPEADRGFLDIGREVMHNDPFPMFAKAIVSGWMIATMVWLIPAAESAKVWIIVMVTYLMALGSFTHIVVGTAEVSYLVFAGEESWGAFWLHFALPTLAGNIVGGTFIFTLISHAQVRSDGQQLRGSGKEAG